MPDMSVSLAAQEDKTQHPFGVLEFGGVNKPLLNQFLRRMEIHRDS